MPRAGRRETSLAADGKRKKREGKALSYGETALKKESRKALFFYSAPSGILAIIVLYTCRKNSSVRVRENTSAMG